MAAGVNTIVLLFLIGFCTCYDLPTSFTKCDRKQSDFSECLTKAVGDALRVLKEPIPELGLYLDPLEFPFVHGNPGIRNANFHQYIKSGKVWGFSSANCSKVVMNFETKNLTIECLIPQLVASAEYRYVGKLYDSPINDSGPAIYTHRDIKIHLSFLLEEHTKIGLKYFIVARNKFTMQSGSIEWYLGNLGNDERSKMFNHHLNDNALEIFNEIKHNYEPVVGNVFAKMFNNLLANVPAVALFGDEQDELNRLL